MEIYAKAGNSEMGVEIARALTAPVTTRNMSACCKNPFYYPKGGWKTFDRTKYAPLIASLARIGCHFGTSSWKYEGWLASFTPPSRYEYRGKIAESRFKRDCLTEYAETFRTVCVDAAYYTFQSEKYLQGLSAQDPG